MNRTALRLLMTASLLVLASVSSLFGQQQLPADALGFILEAHKAGIYPPPSVQITGTVERDGKTEPFRIVATRDEQLRVEYGTAGKDVSVSKPKGSFRDDGQKLTSLPTPPGFSQLDVTGLFLIEQMRVRAVRADWVFGEQVAVAGTAAWHLKVDGGRTERHRFLNEVADLADLYVSEAGLLLGISRTFYDKQPERFTQTFTFSDYREAEGERLLPYRIELYINGSKRQAFLVEAYAFDTNPAREQFEARRSR